MVCFTQISRKTETGKNRNRGFLCKTEPKPNRKWNRRTVTTLKMGCSCTQKLSRHCVWLSNFFTVPSSTLMRWFTVTVALGIFYWQGSTVCRGQRGCAGSSSMRSRAFMVHLHVHWACHSWIIHRVGLQCHGHPRLTIGYTTVVARLLWVSLSLTAGTSLCWGHRRRGHLHYTATRNHRSGHPQLIMHSVNHCHQFSID